MNIALGNDHLGFEIRKVILKDLIQYGHTVIDCGTNSRDSVDYPDYAECVVNAILSGRAQRGVLICGTGIGMSIAANRYPEIRCALCTDLYSAELSRTHNDSNILALRAKNQDIDLNRKILKKWLETNFSGETRHVRRIEKLSKLNQM